MNGKYVGELSVYFYVRKNDCSYEKTQEPVWRKKSSHGEHWQFGQVLYPGSNQSVENYVFEGVADAFELGIFNTNLKYNLLLNNIKYFVS
jgi:hypothetical protein